MKDVEPAPLAAGLHGLCPRCGAGTLFAGGIRFAERCPACGLDFSAFNVGDGPAAFLTLIVGAIITGVALATDAFFRPPLWLHALLWLPITIAAVFGALRVAKGVLIALEYRNRAREGRLAGPGDMVDSEGAEP